MRETIFTNLEDKIGTWWHSVLEEEMLKDWTEDRKKRVTFMKAYQL